MNTIIKKPFYYGMSIQLKMVLSLIIVSIIALGVALFFVFNSLSEIEKSEIETQKHKMEISLNALKKAKIDTLEALSTTLGSNSNLTNDVFFVNSKGIKKEVDGLIKRVTETTSNKNLGVRVLSPDLKILYSSFDENASAGQSLAKQLRVKTAVEKKQNILGEGIFPGGIRIISTNPVIDGNSILSVMITSFGYGSFIESLKNEGTDFLQLVKSDIFSKDQYKSLKKTFDKNEVVNDEYILSKYQFNDEALSEFKKIISDETINQKLKNGEMIFSDKSLIIMIPIIEFDEIIGYNVLMQDAKIFNTILATKQDLVLEGFYTLLITLLSIVFVVYMLIKYKIINVLAKMSKDIDYSVHTGDLSKPVYTTGNGDELDKMATATNNRFEQTRSVIKKVKDYFDHVRDGDFNHVLTCDVKGDMLELVEVLRVTVNQVSSTIESIKIQSDHIKNANYDRVISMKNSSYKGAFKEVSDSIFEAAMQTQNVLKELSIVLEHISKGDLSKKIESNFSGDFDEIKKIVNSTLSSLSLVVSEIEKTSTSLSNGDFTYNSNVNTSGVYQNVLYSLNDSMKNLRKMIIQIKYEAENLEDVSNNLASNGNQISSSLSSQTNVVNETLSLMVDFSNSIGSVQKGISSISSMAQGQKGVVEQGKKNVSQASEAISDIKKQSVSITEFATVIDTIAFQTNLLALNAAVEAARAGDHGRGFAVVAGEVRSLAQKAAEAAKEIKTSSDLTENSINQGVSQISGVSIDMENIYKEAENLTKLVSEINSTSSTQLTGVNRVNASMKDIEIQTKQSMSALNESMNDTKRLSELSYTLIDMTNKFKV